MRGSRAVRGERRAPQRLDALPDPLAGLPCDRVARLPVEGLRWGVLRRDLMAQTHLQVRIRTLGLGFIINLGIL